MQSTTSVPLKKQCIFKRFWLPAEPCRKFSIPQVIYQRAQFYRIQSPLRCFARDQTQTHPISPHPTWLAWKEGFGRKFGRKGRVSLGEIQQHWAGFWGSVLAVPAGLGVFSWVSLTRAQACFSLATRENIDSKIAFCIFFFHNTLQESVFWQSLIVFLLIVQCI